MWQGHAASCAQHFPSWHCVYNSKGACIPLSAGHLWAPGKCTWCCINSNSALSTSQCCCCAIREPLGCPLYAHLQCAITECHHTSCVSCLTATLVCLGVLGTDPDAGAAVLDCLCSRPSCLSALQTALNSATPGLADPIMTAVTQTSSHLGLQLLSSVVLGLEELAVQVHGQIGTECLDQLEPAIETTVQHLRGEVY